MVVQTNTTKTYIHDTTLIIPTKKQGYTIYPDINFQFAISKKYNVKKIIFYPKFRNQISFYSNIFPAIRT